jgi:hypothetical protein
MGPRPVSDRLGMISGMTPVLLPDTYVFATILGVSSPASAEAIATLREAEGLSLILPIGAAKAHGFDTSQPMRCITLNVYSALDGVGLTAAVARALADQGIACNMVAGFHHDHAFVPAGRADDAVQTLIALQSAAKG